MSITKTIVRDYLPPAATQLLRRIRGGGARFGGEYTSWEDASSNSSGYDAKEILAKVLSATLRVKRGEVAFERDSVVFEKIEYAWPVLSGLMWAAARNNGTLNVLDFGGALGSSYFQNRQFLQALPDVRWNVVEQEHYVDAGRTYIQDEALRFYKTIEECLADTKPNVILLSSVLQYIQNPFELLKITMDTEAQYIILDRTPFCNNDKDKLCVQHVPSEIFESKLICWVFSLEKFTKMLSNEFDLIADFLNVDQIGGIKSQFMGSIWQRRVLPS